MSNAGPHITIVDTEHTPARTAGCAVMALAFAGVFVLTNALVPNGALIALFAGILAAAGSSFIAEGALKQRWRSTRELRIDADRISLHNKNKEEYGIDPRQQVNPLLWHFAVKRNGRVKKGWFVLALALEQDDVFVPVYTFASPEQFAKLPYHRQFRLLERKQKDDLKTAGITRRLLMAESYRGVFGAEVTLEQFSQIMTELAERFTHWMPQP